MDKERISAFLVMWILARGITLAQDPDGDGIPSTIDNCPTVFNPQQGPSLRLSPPMTVGGSLREDFIDTRAFLVTPDGSRVLYIADQDVNQRFDLYAIPTNGGPAIRLSEGVPLGAQTDGEPPGVQGFELSPDGTMVVFITRNPNDMHSIWTVPVSGGAPVHIAEGFGFGAPTYWTRWLLFTPDGSRLVYELDVESPINHQLFSVPVNGGTPIPLTSATGLTPVPFRRPREPVHISPNGADVFFIGVDMNGRDWVYRTTIDGGIPVQVSEGYGVENFILSPDGSKVIYQVEISDKGTVYSVPAAGGPAIALHGAALDASRTLLTTPDGSLVVFRAGQTNQHGTVLGNAYSVPVDGGGVVQLSAVDVVGGVTVTKITQDGSTVVYFGPQNTYFMYEIYSVPTYGGTQIKLNGPLVANADVEIFAIAPNDSDVVYVADEDTVGVDEIYSVPIGGGASVRLNPPLVPGGDVDSSCSSVPCFWADLSFLITPDSSTVIYKADHRVDDVVEVLAVPIGGGSSELLNDTPVTGGDVTHIGITPDGSTYLYVADQNTDGVLELFHGRFDSDADGDGVLEICDSCPGLYDPDQTDVDGDGAGAACECDDSNAGAQNPGAGEINDGLDNQCPGEEGFGSIDEIEGEAGFNNEFDRDEYSWPAQPGASEYQVARAESSRFDVGCTIVGTTSASSLVDSTQPGLGVVLYYLVRPSAPHAGDWGQTSSGTPRSGACL